MGERRAGFPVRVALLRREESLFRKNLSVG
jgi:hypothetical protein